MRTYLAVHAFVNFYSCHGTVQTDSGKILIVGLTSSPPDGAVFLWRDSTKEVSVQSDIACML